MKKLIKSVNPPIPTEQFYVLLQIHTNMNLLYINSKTCSCFFWPDFFIRIPYFSGFFWIFSGFSKFYAGMPRNVHLTKVIGLGWEESIPGLFSKFSARIIISMLDMLKTPHCVMAQNDIWIWVFFIFLKLQLKMAFSDILYFLPPSVSFDLREEIEQNEKMRMMMLFRISLAFFRQLQNVW